jgi:hypothetical protein
MKTTFSFTKTRTVCIDDFIPGRIVVFAVLAVLCLAVGEALKRNYFKYIHKEGEEGR